MILHPVIAFMTSPLFTLHPRLEQDCLAIGCFDLCRLLLMNDCQYPWFVLVPELPGIREIFQLAKPERLLLSEESNYLAEQLARLYGADKMNIAAIGNVVPQLHVHHIVRFENDLAWPKPVWGFAEAVPYPAEQLDAVLPKLREALPLCRFD